MTVLSDFSGMVLAGNIAEALSHFKSNSGSITREHRSRVADRNISADYSIYNELILGRASRGDLDALDTVIKLISGGVLLNEVDKEGFTPVGLLAFVGASSAVEIALRNGANPNGGSSAPLAACFMGHTLPTARQKCAGDRIAIAKLLIDGGALVNGNNSTPPPLFEAIQSGYDDAIRLLVSRGAELNRHYDFENRGNFAGTSLHWAAGSAYAHGVGVATFSLLVDLGASPATRNRGGECVADYIYQREWNTSDDVKPLLAFLASKEEWKSASWRLSEEEKSSIQPLRRDSTANPSGFGGYEFRLGDKVRVYRRYNGFYRPPKDTGHSRPVIALPGLTATVCGLRHGSSGLSRLVLRFDPGNWEEADNFSNRVSLGVVNTEFDPARVVHVDQGEMSLSKKLGKQVAKMVSTIFKG